MLSTGYCTHHANQAGWLASCVPQEPQSPVSRHCITNPSPQISQAHVRSRGALCPRLAGPPSDTQTSNGPILAYGPHTPSFRHCCSAHSAAASRNAPCCAVSCELLQAAPAPPPVAIVILAACFLARGPPSPQRHEGETDKTKCDIFYSCALSSSHSAALLGNPQARPSVAPKSPRDRAGGGAGLASCTG